MMSDLGTKSLRNTRGVPFNEDVCCCTQISEPSKTAIVPFTENKMTQSEKQHFQDHSRMKLLHQDSKTFFFKTERLHFTQSQIH